MQAQMANRSQILLGKIGRKLRTVHGFSNDDITPDDIYDEMQSGVDAVFSELKVLEREFSIMLQEDVEHYPLKTGWSFNTDLNSQANATNPDETVEANVVTGWSVTGGTVEATANRRTNSKGYYALKYTKGSYLDGNVILTPITPIAATFVYLEFWARADAASSISFWLSDSNHEQKTANVLSFDLTTSWAKYYGYLYLEADATNLEFFTTLADAGWVEIDDLSLLSQSPNFSARKAVGKIRGFIKPTTYNYAITVVSNEEYLLLPDLSISDVGQPLYASVFDDEIYFYPVPTEDNVGDEIKIWAYMHGSESKVSDSNPPETPDIFDDAIELYTLWKFTGEEKLFQHFTRHIKMCQPKVTVKGHILQSARVT